MDSYLIFNDILKCFQRFLLLFSYFYGGPADGRFPVRPAGCRFYTLIFPVVIEYGRLIGTQGELPVFFCNPVIISKNFLKS